MAVIARKARRRSIALTVRTRSRVMTVSVMTVRARHKGER